MSLPQVAIVVLNWNGKRDTLKCLKSLATQQDVDAKIILVDNGSTDDSVIAVAAEFPGVEVIEVGANLGYAGGNNIGLNHALQLGFEYILVLNNDTTIDAHCTAALVADLEANPLAAAACPKTFFLDSPATIYFAGGKLNGDGSPEHIGWGQPDSPRFSTGETEWITGCAILFRARLLQEIKLFEAKFFLLFEDLDWSMRARRLGYSLRFVAEAKVWHKGSASFGKTFSPFYWYYYSRNCFLWIERNFSFNQKPRLYYLALKRTWQNAVRANRDLPLQERKQIRRSVTRGLNDYLLRRFDEQHSWK
jgi:GT2 family glycosyltransferase